MRVPSTKQYTIRDTGETAINSGRPRWSVYCNRCNRYVHTGTTDACWQIEMHEWAGHPPNRVPPPIRGENSLSM